MPSLFQDFGFVEWWKALAVVLTGIFAFLALTKENKDKKTGALTTWGKISIIGIVIASAGGLLAQIAESSNDANAEKIRHSEIVSLLADQARLLRPLKVDKVYGEFKVPCESVYLSFCNSVRAFRKSNPTGIFPISLFDTFPGGRSAVIGLSLRFFANDGEAKAQLIVRDDQKSKYSAYMQLPLIAGNDDKCGMRVGIFGPDDQIRLFIYASCPFLAVNNFGGLQSHLDLNDLEFSTQIGPFSAGAPSLEPISISMIYADAQRDTITNLSRVQANNETIYIAKFVGSGVPSLPGGAAGEPAPTRIQQ
jgi:hypothetical protein